MKMHKNPTILLTGASGFIGRRLAQSLASANEPLICTSREPLKINGAECRMVADLGPATDWSHCLGGVSTVVHCAARVHVMRDTARDPLLAFRQANVEGTRELARQAAAAGVKHFIFLSSVKVNGEETPPKMPFAEFSLPHPSDPYAISKYEAEQALFDLGCASGMAITIIRPPLVYGPGVGANFLGMLRWVQRQIPLPFASIDNQRSFVYVDNLVNLIICCIRNLQSRNQVFLVSDGQDLSTPELLAKSAAALGVPSRLLPCPTVWLTRLASLAGKKAVADRLCKSLQVDIGKAKLLLGWRPPCTVEQGLLATVKNMSLN